MGFPKLWSARTRSLDLPEPAAASGRQILEQIALPLCLFAGVLLLLLLLSWTLLLPRFTTVEVGGMKRNALTLHHYVSDLQAQLQHLEEERDTVVVPRDHAAYSALLDFKLSQPSLDEIGNAIEQAGRDLMPGHTDIVYLHRITYKPAEGVLLVEGDVRNVDTQSMTLLAQYAESLRDLPFIEQISRPQFVRADDPSIGIHSPFSLTLTLRP